MHTNNIYIKRHESFIWHFYSHIGILYYGTPYSLCDGFTSGNVLGDKVCGRNDFPHHWTTILHGGGGSQYNHLFLLNPSWSTIRFTTPNVWLRSSLAAERNFSFSHSYAHTHMYERLLHNTKHTKTHTQTHTLKFICQ